MSSKTALIVDDSKSARFALRKYLENHSYQVEAVDSALAAYEYLKTQVPSIIFLDHIMPGIDGFEALQQIRGDARCAGVPVVLCSSNEGGSFNEEARSKGAASVLQKPPSPEQLLRVLGMVQGGAPAATPAAAAPAVPPPAPAKVTNIREPEVAIEQAVMKALRTAMPATPPVASSAVDPAATGRFDAAATGRFDPAATGRFDPAATGRFDPAATGRFSANGVLRDQIDERIRKVTQDLFVQVASLRADIGQLEDGASGAGLRDEVEGLRAGLNALEQGFASELAALREQMAEGFARQSLRLEELAQSVRRAAAEEAHAEAERAVMAAAARVSDQLAESIMHAFRAPPAQRRSEG